MNAEWVGLVGVVVGAVLGGASQIVADGIRRRDERKRTLRDERRAAYLEFLAAVPRSMGTFQQMGTRFTEAFSSGAESVKIENSESMTDSLTRLMLAVSAVELVAPADTLGAARMLQGNLMMFMVPRVADANEVVDRVVKSQAEFTELAKRDLGLG